VRVRFGPARDPGLANLNVRFLDVDAESGQSAFGQVRSSNFAPSNVSGGSRTARAPCPKATIQQTARQPVTRCIKRQTLTLAALRIGAGGAKSQPSWRMREGWLHLGRSAEALFRRRPETAAGSPPCAAARPRAPVRQRPFKSWNRRKAWPLTSSWLRLPSGIRMLRLFLKLNIAPVPAAFAGSPSPARSATNRRTVPCKRNLFRFSAQRRSGSAI
jgi:hypothetical protein